MDQLPVHEIVVFDRGMAGIQVGMTVILFQPGLTLIGPLFIKHLIDGIVTLTRLVHKVHDFLVGKVFFELHRRRGPQPLEILDGPARRLAPRELPFPGLILTFVIEHLGLGPLLRPENGGVHERHEPVDPEQRRPFTLEQVHTQTLDMGPVGIRIREEHDLTVAQAPVYILEGGIITPRLQAQNLLQVGDFLVLRDPFEVLPPDIEELPLERVNPVAVPVLTREATDDPRHGRQPLTQNQDTILGLGGTGLVGIDEIGDTPNRAGLGPVGLSGRHPPLLDLRQ